MKTVLLVDDLEEIRDELGHWLRRKGYDVVTLENGAKALDWLMQNRAVEEGRKEVFVILSDNSMPEMTGEELQRELQSHKIFKHIPFIMATATPNPQLETTVKGRGGHFLKKPLDPNMLEGILASICR